MMAGSHRHQVLRWPAFLLCLASLPLRAIEPDIELRSIQHQAWVDNRHVAAGTRAIARTPDDKLFLGSPTGIGTFDGRGFELVGAAGPVQFTSRSVAAACSDRQGRLWIGFESGEVGWLLDQDIGNYPIGAGPPGGTILAMTCAADGSVWVAAQGGVARWQTGTWRHFGPDDGIPAGPVCGVFRARDGSVWIATEQSLLKAPSAAARFVLIGSLPVHRSTPTPIAQTSDDALWIGNPAGLLRLAAHPGAKPEHWADEPVQSLLVDRDGMLWVGGDDLRRYPPSAAQRDVQRFTQADGLSGKRVNALFEDSNGSVWAATDRGLDTFTRSSFVPIALPLDGGDKILVAGDNDSLWVGLTEQSLVLRLVAGRVMQRFPVAGPTAGYRDAHGGIWFAGSDGITHIVADRSVTVPLPTPAHGRSVRSMTRDADGALWVSIDGVGVHRLIGNRWLPGTGIAGLPEETPTALATDASGHVWLGYLSGALARVGANGVEHFSRADSMDIGMIRALYASGPRVWIGGDKGMQLHDGQRLLRVIAANCGGLYAVSGIIETPDGELWLNRPFGPAQFRSGVSQASAGKPMDCNTFGREEGLPDSGQVRVGAAPMAWTGDGRLWVATRSGVAWTDAMRSRYVPTPPTVTVASLRSEKAYFLSAQLAPFEPGTRTLQIEYRPLGTERMARTRFRYRVPGIIDSWRVVGSTTTAYLNNLRPGHYVFEVQATADVAGPWSPSGSVKFVILPWFYETTWFLVVAALATVAGILLIFRMQLRRANLRLKDRLEERTLERERISRELHDTLLQGVQGLILRFQSVAARIPRSEPAAPLMEAALDSADAVLTESRDRVAELRELPPPTTELPEAIAEMAQVLLIDRDIRLASAVKGVVRSLDGGVNSELFLIAREALSNAIRHSGARNIHTELSYERMWLRLSVQDDGEGIAREIIAAGGRAGHFGLRGMQERARRLRATFRIHSEPAQGTLIEIRIPGALAYFKELK